MARPYPLRVTDPTFPIDSLLPDIGATLHAHTRLVLEAPPGAGKTTRFPRALLDQSWCAGRVLVSEPRRIAARLSAARVAEEMGVPVGSRVGYRVRFDERASAETRLVYMTEGLLLKTLLKNPTLHGISALVFDEVHERSAQLDFRAAGPRFGKQTKALAAEIKALTGAPLAKLAAGQSIAVTVDGETVGLTPDLVKLTSKGKAGAELATDGNITVLLDTQLTEELKSEGFARELVSATLDGRDLPGEDAAMSERNRVHPVLVLATALSLNIVAGCDEPKPQPEQSTAALQSQAAASAKLQEILAKQAAEKAKKKDEPAVEGGQPSRLSRQGSRTGGETQTWQARGRDCEE